MAGDEMGRTQKGNNNAYCQDNETSWVNWDLEPWQRELLAFTRYLVRLYKRHPVLRRRAFFHGRPIRGYDVRDLAWFRPDGSEMNEQDWQNGTQALMLRLDGKGIDERDERGRQIFDDTLLIAINGSDRTLSFALPKTEGEALWTLVFNTQESHPNPGPTIASEGMYESVARSMALFRTPSRPDAEDEPEAR